MKKQFSVVLLIVFVCLASFAQSTPKVSAKDFKLFLGSWRGSLTYLDYSSKKSYSMPADITIKRIGKTNKFIFSNSYPNEPNANSAETITISKDGRMIGDEVVKSKQKLGDGSLEIVTEILSTDGNENKPALIRHTYTVSKTSFVNRKEIQFVGQTEWIKRNEFRYKKVEPDGKQ